MLQSLPDSITNKHGWPTFSVVVTTITPVNLVVGKLCDSKDWPWDDRQPKATAVKMCNMWEMWLNVVDRILTAYFFKIHSMNKIPKFRCFVFCWQQHFNVMKHLQTAADIESNWAFMVFLSVCRLEEKKDIFTDAANDIYEFLSVVIIRSQRCLLETDSFWHII